MCKLFCFVDHPTTYSVFAIVFSISLFDYWGRATGPGVLHINHNGFRGFGQTAADFAVTDRANTIPSHWFDVFGFGYTFGDCRHVGINEITGCKPLNLFHRRGIQFAAATNARRIEIRATVQRTVVILLVIVGPEHRDNLYCLFHILIGLWPGFPRAGVSHLSDANIFFEKQIGHSFGHFAFAVNVFVESPLINAHRIVFNNNGDFVKVGVKSFFDNVLFHCLFLYREPARAVVFYLEPGTKVQLIFILPNIFSIFFRFFAKNCGFRARFRAEPGIFAYDNPLNRSLCLFKKSPAVIVGANPGKFTRRKPKRKPKAAPHTRPGTGKNPRKVKRNREPPDYPGNSLSLPCLFTHVSPTRYFDRRARETGCGSFIGLAHIHTRTVPGPTNGTST